MITVDFVRLMAAYTAWQNNSIYTAASSLSDAARKENRGAFFESIHATLNHLLWGDQVWLHRLADAPQAKAKSIGESKDQYGTWEDLSKARRLTDNAISSWADKMEPEQLEGELTWFSAAINEQIYRPRQALILQLFNHGTHHRGQVHAMLTAAGARPDDTDLPFMPAAYYQWPTPAQ